MRRLRRGTLGTDLYRGHYGQHRRKSTFRGLTIERLDARDLLTAAGLVANVPVLDPINDIDGSATPNGEETGGLDPSMFIVNGTPTNGFPSVGIVGDTSGGYCTGTLIAPQFVLTAGHCAEGVANTAGRFRLGNTNYATSRVIMHPQYNGNAIGGDNANDIAIYQLSQPVNDVTPSPIYRNAPRVGELLTLVGFGAGGTGTTGHDGTFGTKRVGTTPIDQVTPRLMIWRFDHNGEANTAPGDSGGPAFLLVNGTYLVAGVTSGGDQANAAIGDRSFDTRVDAYQTWIDSIVGGTTTLPSLRIVATDASAAETRSGQTPDTGAFTISRTGASTTALTVNLTRGGTATNGVDYVSLATTVTIPAGQSSVVIPLTPIDDTLVEPTEDVRLTVGTSTAYTVDSSASTAMVTIADNDAPTSTTVSILATDADAAETRSGETVNTGTVRISRTGSTSASLVVGLNISGTATHGNDYSSIPSSVTIPANQSFVDVVVRPLDDNLVEGTESAMFRIVAGANYVVSGTQSSATIQIRDNDVATSNDHFVNRATLSGNNPRVTGSNVGATFEANEPNNAGVSGGKSMWWSWTAPATGVVIVSTHGSNYDTTLGVYTGSSVGNLTRVASNDDANFYAGIFTSEVYFYALAGRTYQISVDGYDGASGNIVLSVNSLGGRGAGPRIVPSAFAANDPSRTTVTAAERWRSPRLASWNTETSALTGVLRAAADLVDRCFQDAHLLNELSGSV